jgi:hypothetical protein
MKKNSLTIFSLIIITLSLTYLSLAEPNGASVTPGASERSSSGQASNHSALAGNMTELTIFAGGSDSQTWQGYYGNVSGGLTLGDSSNNVLYNWSVITPAGEVYASTNESIDWINIQCFNFTATGTYVDESGTGGTTNLYGTNATTFENSYNIDPTDMDGINETFAANNHDLFYTSSMTFSADECSSLQLFTNASTQEDGAFEEMILYEPVSRSVIFSSILEKSKEGFNGKPVDFQMIVPEDGHGSDTATTPYFFFIEIE